MADIFVFPSPSEAQSFFEQAAGPRCHPYAVRLAASWPPGARNLVWQNPDAATENDVFLLRGETSLRFGAGHQQG